MEQPTNPLSPSLARPAHAAPRCGRRDRVVALCLVVMAVSLTQPVSPSASAAASACPVGEARVHEGLREAQQRGDASAWWTWAACLDALSPDAIRAAIVGAPEGFAPGPRAQLARLGRRFEIAVPRAWPVAPAAWVVGPIPAPGLAEPPTLDCGGVTACREGPVSAGADGELRLAAWADAAPGAATDGLTARVGWELDLSTAEAPAEVALAFGVAGHVSIWLDGVRVAAWQAPGPAIAGQRIIRARLHPGRHGLVAVVRPGAEASPAVSLATRGPVVVRPADNSKGPRATAPTAAAGGGRVGVDVFGARQLAALVAERSWRQRVALGNLLAHRRMMGLPPAEEGAPLLEDVALDVADRAPGRPELLAWVAQMPNPEARASVITLARAGGVDGRPGRPPRPNERRALDVAAAWLSADRGLGLQAASTLDRAGVAARPSPEQQVADQEILARAAAHGAHGEAAKAWSWLRPSVLGDDGQPRPAAALRLLEAGALAADAAGQAEHAMALADALVQGEPGASRHRWTAVDLATRAGQVARAAVVAEAASARWPSRLRMALMVARLETALGKADSAASRLVEVERRAGGESELWAEVAHAWLGLGRVAEATDAWRRVSELAPGDAEAREALARLAPEEHRPDEPEWRLDVGELVARATAEGGGADGSALATLGRETVVSVRDDGGVRRWTRRLVLVRRVPRDREARTASLRFDPSIEEARVAWAGVHRAGTFVPEPARELATESEGWFGLYYDRRRLEVPFDGLEPGDVLEVRERVETRGTPVIPGAVDVLERLQSRHPVSQVRWTLEVPESLEDAVRVRTGPRWPSGSLAVEEVVSEGGRRWTLEARDLAALPTEPGRPGDAELGAWIQASSYRSWDEVGARWAALAEPQRVRTPAMDAWLDARAGARADRGAVRRIVEDLARAIRYVGLEFGVHGYQPYRTDSVWGRRFGDCKDQATLLTTLLTGRGVDARVALVRTRSLGRLDDPLPSLAVFDHAVVWIEPMARFVDPTVPRLGLGDLPGAVQGSQALVLGEAGGAGTRWTVVPEAPATRHALEGEYTITLRPDGDARLDGLARFVGTAAVPYRGRFAEAAGRAQRFAALVSGRYPGAQLVRHEVRHASDLARPLELAFGLDVPSLARTGPGGVGLRVPAPAGGQGLVRSWAPDPTRATPRRLGPASVRRTTTRYVLPRGFWAAELPAGGAAATPFGHFDVRWRRDLAGANAVTVTAELVVEVDQISATDFLEFRRFLEAWDAAVAAPLDVVPRSGGGRDGG